MYYHPIALAGADPRNDMAERSSRANLLRQIVVEPERGRLESLRKILIPIDGSDRAFDAITHLLDTLQCEFPVEVHLVNVQPLFMPGDFAMDVAVRAERAARLVAGQEALGRGRAMLEAAGIACKTALMFAGDPAKAIARHVREHGCTTIVMATRGLSPLKGMLRRSVAARVVGLADVPVTLVKSAGRPRDDQSRSAHTATALNDAASAKGAMAHVEV